MIKGTNAAAFIPFLRYSIRTAALRARQLTPASAAPPNTPISIRLPTGSAMRQARCPQLSVAGASTDAAPRSSARILPVNVLKAVRRQRDLHMTGQAGRITRRLVRPALAEQKQQPVLDQINAFCILTFPDLKAEHVAIKANHCAYTPDNQSKAIQSHCP